MTHSFKLPDLGEGIHEGEVTAVTVSVGDHVQEGDVILEVDRRKIDNVKVLSEVLDNTKDMKSVLFLVTRGGRTLFIAVKP